MARSVGIVSKRLWGIAWVAGAIGALLVAHHAGAAPPEDWPRWSGTQCQMVSNETGWSFNWQAQPPSLAWTAELGVGFSSVAVVGDRVYSMGYEDENDVVHCLNASTGERLWRFAYPSLRMANLHDGGPGSTPTVAGEHVYTIGREGHCYCLSASDGREVWRQFVPDLTGVKAPAWGFTTSPLIRDGRVILEMGCMIALDAQDGSLVWKSQAHPPGYGSVIPFQHGERQFLATLNNEGLMVVDAGSGREVALQKWTTSWDTNSTTPIHSDGQLFISTGYERGCAAYRFDGAQLTEVYAHRELSNHMNNSIVYRGHVFGIDGNTTDRVHRLVCLNAETGEKKWSKPGTGCGSILIVDGNLLVLSDKGMLACGPADGSEFVPTGKLAALTGRCWTVPVFCNGRIYCRNSAGILVCWALQPSGGASGIVAERPVEKLAEERKE